MTLARTGPRSMPRRRWRKPGPSRRPCPSGQELKSRSRSRASVRPFGPHGSTDGVKDAQQHRQPLTGISHSTGSRRTMIVELTPDELHFADEIGRRRYAAARGHGYRHAHGADDSLIPDLAGARAEAAFRRMLGVPLSAWNIHMGRGWSARGADVAGWEVRSTDWRLGCLLLHPEDPDDLKFALIITADDPIFRCAGWILAAEGKSQRWWRSPTGRPAFFVPQSELHPLPSEQAKPELRRCRVLAEGREGCGCITCRRELASMA
jgi:hypothetical protein